MDIAWRRAAPWGNSPLAQRSKERKAAGSRVLPLSASFDTSADAGCPAGTGSWFAKTRRRPNGLPHVYRSALIAVGVKAARIAPFVAHESRSLTGHGAMQFYILCSSRMHLAGFFIQLRSAKNPDALLSGTFKT
jgi:hypothetical protein